MAKEEMLVGLDLGTTKICAIIAEVGEAGDLRIIGVGSSPSEGGLRRGVVVNIDKTAESIKRAVHEAELMSGAQITSAYVGIAGDHIRSFDNRGFVAVSGGDSEITERDLERVIDHAKAVAIPIDREIVHVLPQEYIVDDQPGVKEPLGMSGVRLEAEVHIITGAVTSAQNIVKSVRRAGIEVMDLALQPLASSYSVLSADEQELGVGILDVGGGTTDIAMFFKGSVRHTAVIGLGGQNVTNDIAIGLRTPWGQAESIKRQFGCALGSMVDGDEIINVPGVGGRPARQVPRKELSAIIGPRMEEIFELALREVRKSDYADILTTGIVLTGGGSMLEGAVELAEQIFDMPVKLGVPQGVGGLVDAVNSPIYATAVGLVIFGLNKQGYDGRIDSDDGRLFRLILKKMKSWVREFF